MPHCLLNLGLEIRVLFQQFAVCVTAKLRMLIHVFLDVAELCSHDRFVEVWLHCSCESLKFGLPEWFTVNEIQVICPIGAHDSGMVFIKFREHLVACVLLNCHIWP